MRRLEHLPVACGTLWCSVAVVIDRIEEAGFDCVIGVLEVVEGRVERQPGAHPQKHAGAQAIAGCPEFVFAIAGILQILAHRFDLFLCLERRKLQAQRTAVLIREEIVELRRIRIHSADKILNAV